jgi:hypothetical protein
VDKILEYGRIYSEIAKGYSIKHIEGKSYYFKHPTQVEFFSVYHTYESICADAKARGLQTEEEKIKQAIDGGWWSDKKEDQIAELKSNITNLLKTKSQLIYPSQKEQIDKQILVNERILVSYAKERNGITGYTVEKYANEKFYDEMILNLTFKNSDMTIRIFEDEDEYYYLSEDIVEKVRDSFQSVSALFNNHNLKLVSASGFFQNILYLTEGDPMSFWGKPAVDCTKNQIDTLMYAKSIKNLIKYHAETSNPLDDDVINTPERLIQLLDDGAQASSKNSNTQSSKQAGDNKVMSYVGATKQDLKQMGVKVEKIKGKSLLQLAEENGGVLEKHQYLNARENM